jgi:hypothetical protein
MPNIGYLRLTYTELKAKLDLPDTVNIIAVDDGPFVHEHGAVHITVQHPDFPLTEERAPTPRLQWQDIDACRNSPKITCSTR